MNKLITLIFIVCLTGCSTTGGIFGGTGCGTTGGTIGGLFPAPKFTKGKISDGKYTSPKKEFSISVPNWDDKGEYMYMQIKEQFSESDKYLSFGPAVSNKNIYRVSLMFRNHSVTLESAKNIIFNDCISKIENAYGSHAQFISEKNGMFPGKKSISRVYKQHVSEKPVGFSTIRPEAVFYHAIDLIDFGTHYVFFWVEIQVAPPGDASIEEALINGTHPEHVNFVNSFKLLAPALTGYTLQYKIEDPIYFSQSNEFQFTMPFEPGQCIEKEENESETESIFFSKCDNSHKTFYLVYWHRLEQSETAEKFYKIVEEKDIPDSLEEPIMPGKPAVLISSERTYINSNPSVTFTSEMVREGTRFYHNAVIMSFGDRLAYISSVSNEKGGSAFQDLLNISNSIKRLK